MLPPISSLFCDFAAYRFAEISCLQQLLLDGKKSWNIIPWVGIYILDTV